MKIFSDVTHIPHLAADTSFSRPVSNWAVNFDGTKALANAAEKMPMLQRFIHVSTATICGVAPYHVVHEKDFPRKGIDHLFEYTRTKAVTEYMFRERSRNLPIIIVRPSIVAGHTKLGVRRDGLVRLKNGSVGLQPVLKRAPVVFDLVGMCNR